MRTKPVALVAALIVAGITLTACHGDRPGYWGPGRHHHHHHDDGDYRDDGYRR